MHPGMYLFGACLYLAAYCCRAEREKAEKELAEKKRQEEEKERRKLAERQQRARILQESAQQAVNDHFNESLKRVS